MTYSKTRYVKCNGDLKALDVEKLCKQIEDIPELKEILIEEETVSQCLQKDITGLMEIAQKREGRAVVQPENKQDDDMMENSERFTELQGKYVALLKTSETHEVKNHCLQMDFNTCRAKCKLLNRKIDIIQEDKDNLDQKYHDMIREKRPLQGQNDGLQENMLRLRAENNELKEHLRTPISNTSHDALEGYNNMHQKYHDMIRESIKIHKNQQETHLASIIVLEEIITTCQKEITGQQENIKVLQTQNNGLQEDIKTVRVQNNGLQEDIKTVRVQNSGLQEDIKTVRVQNNGLQEDIKTVRVQNSGLQEDIETVRVQNNGLQEDIKTVRVQNSGLQENIKKVQGQNDGLQENMLRLRAKNNELKEIKVTLLEQSNRYREYIKTVHIKNNNLKENQQTVQGKNNGLQAREQTVETQSNALNEMSRTNANERPTEASGTQKKPTFWKKVKWFFERKDQFPIVPAHHVSSDQPENIEPEPGCSSWI
ncbi:hypothetical protein CesoFtcFv8_024185 [Champsocephalus esox]|uniref:Uncharacterized protein n=1 Tax=Champsocephalus esox TaxID=159716 RepID=A0AAN8B5W8_9TELE|nr:hypothetical protein CesoFtcFv8_024185 [Champsocephalus esox]